ncbi:MAG: T9SS type A sorting domain-containing protein [Dysgonamonadaceae bacterium]|nr:T9SS type A sorting domain-containing protein [Dysgonamonadaceae bacterium]
MRATPTDNGTATINVSHLPSGVYFLKIGSKTAKFVKE